MTQCHTASGWQTNARLPASIAVCHPALCTHQCLDDFDQVLGGRNITTDLAQHCKTAHAGPACSRHANRPVAESLYHRLAYVHGQFGLSTQLPVMPQALCVSLLSRSVLYRADRLSTHVMSSLQLWGAHPNCGESDRHCQALWPRLGVYLVGHLHQWRGVGHIVTDVGVSASAQQQLHGLGLQDTIQHTRGKMRVGCLISKFWGRQLQY